MVIVYLTLVGLYEAYTELLDSMEGEVEARIHYDDSMDFSPLSK